MCGDNNKDNDATQSVNHDSKTEAYLGGPKLVDPKKLAEAIASDSSGSNEPEAKTESVNDLLTDSEKNRLLVDLYFKRRKIKLEEVYDLSPDRTELPRLIASGPAIDSHEKETNPHIQRIHNFLMGKELLSPAEIGEVIVEAQADGITMSEILDVAKKSIGIDVLNAVSKRSGIPIINLEEIVPDPEIVGLIDPEFIKLHKVLPVKLESDDLTVAMADPLNKKAIEDMHLITGYNIVPHLCDPDVLDAKIEHLSG